MTDNEWPGWARKAKSGWSEFQERHGLVGDGAPGLKSLSKVLDIEKALGDQPERSDVPADGFSYGGDEIRRGVSRDPQLLLPAFAAKVETLFQRLRKQGHDPMLFEGYRSPERAQRLSDKGTGIKLSMHIYGAAVDILDAEGMWSASRDFWDAIGDEAEALGLTVLYRNGRRRDRPHVQAVAVKDQHKFRGMSEAERREFVA